MKQIFILILLLAGQPFYAQQAMHLQVPFTSPKALGFPTNVTQVATGYYKTDSASFEPAMLEIYTFTDKEQLEQHYIRIFGDFASETAHNYHYNAEGLLDSIVTVTTNKNFNSVQRFQYNNKNQIVSSNASGVYTNFKDTYTYNQDNLLEQISRHYSTGNVTKAMFSNQSHVSEEDYSNNELKRTRNFLYDDSKLLASSNSEQPYVVFYLDQPETHIEVAMNDKQDPYKFMLSYLELKQKDNNAYNDVVLADENKIAFEIAAESRDESGLWTKRLQFDFGYAQPQKRLLFRQYNFADGSEIGNTNVDIMFFTKTNKINR